MLDGKRVHVLLLPIWIAIHVTLIYSAYGAFKFLLLSDIDLFQIGCFFAKSPKIHPILQTGCIGSVTETHPSIYQISWKYTPKGRNIICVYQHIPSTSPPPPPGGSEFKTFLVVSSTGITENVDSFRPHFQIKFDQITLRHACFGCFLISNAATIIELDWIWLIIMIPLSN